MRKVAAHNKNPAPTFWRKCKFFKRCFVLPPLFCAIERWEEFLQEQAQWASAECVSGRWLICASEWKWKNFILVFRFHPLFCDKGECREKVSPALPFWPSFCNKGECGGTPISLGKVHSETVSKLCNHLKIKNFQKMVVKIALPMPRPWGASLVYLATKISRSANLDKVVFNAS